MIDLIKQSAVPATMMRSAARGALSLPSAEVIEILVYLSEHQLFGEQARLTLAGFDAQAMQQVAADPQAAPEVLRYLASPKNIRPNLVSALVENPSVQESSLLELAQAHSQEVLTAMAASPRVRSLSSVLTVMSSNDLLSDASRSEVKAILGAQSDPVPSGETPADAVDPLQIEAEISRFVAENAAEIAAEEAKGFELVDVTEDEKREIQAHAAAAVKAEKSRMSPLQRIARLSVGERVQLAMKGNKEERFILIRDGAKVVSSGVLESPKLTDQEVEMFAGMKGVPETVLRGISQKRKFVKLYAVIRALTMNPRCPFDVALPLMKSLLVLDLKNLSTNKNVSDTIRKVAFKMYKEKSTTKKN